MLSYRGLPCPNLCTGGQNCHSRYEFVSVPDMRKVVQLLARILEKHAG
jgi:tripeptide aminopeptidase